MRPVLTPAEAARVDEASTDPVTLLMERAGRAVAAAAVRMGARYGTRVSVLCGPGNNGGDGYVAARLLHQRGVGVTVHALGEPKTEAARTARRRATVAGVMVKSIADPPAGDLTIDALFGGGWRRGLDPELKPWIDHRAPVLAVDGPSGLDPLTGMVEGEAFTAERTITFHTLKTGHLLGEGPDRCGVVEVADIGLLGGEPALLVAEQVDAPLPTRPRQAHKWSAGSVLVAGGAAGMLGAAVLAGQAALHFGAGAVGLAVPDVSGPAAAAAAPELLQYSLDRPPAGRYRVLVIGPGLGRDHDETAGALLDGWEGPVVADADALPLLESARPPGPLVVTPHHGEFRRLAGAEPGPEAAATAARRLQAVVILKGNPTLITDGSTPWVVTTGGPELATIGTGDVLAGMVAALLAAGLSPLEAARAAAYWHGVAARDLAAGTTVTAAKLAVHVGRYR
jgi:hydroxyethylthiazole kinase-like uncharacterized protein yjeF